MLSLLRQVEQVRRGNTSSGGRPPVDRIYLLTPMVCGECGGQVTAAGNGRYRCRVAADKSGRCAQPSVDADALERAADEWLLSEITVTSEVEAEAARIVASQVTSFDNEQRAADIRRRMARLGDRYEAEDPTLPRELYLERMRELKDELARAERRDEQRTSEEAIRLVRDLARLYRSTTAEKRRDLWRLLFSRIVLKDKQLVRVRPNELLLPLFASLQQRSRPGSDPGHRTLIHGVSVGGLEDLMELLAAGAA